MKARFDGMTEYLKDRNGLIFESLEDAKRYYYPTEDINPESYLGDDYTGYVQNWEEYKRQLLDATSLQKLAYVLNKWSDWFSDGSEVKVIQSCQRIHKGLETSSLLFY